MTSSILERVFDAPLQASHGLLILSAIAVAAFGSFLIWLSSRSPRS